MKRSLVKVTVGCSAAALLFTMFISEVALSSDYWGEEGLRGFRIGDSCAALAYTDEIQLEEMTSSASRIQFDAFCFPEEPFFCSDYSNFLSGLGEMVVGSDGYMCRFIPASET